MHSSSCTIGILRPRSCSSDRVLSEACPKILFSFSPFVLSCSFGSLQVSWSPSSHVPYSPKVIFQKTIIVQFLVFILSLSHSLVPHHALHTIYLFSFSNVFSGLVALQSCSRKLILRFNQQQMGHSCFISWNSGSQWSRSLRGQLHRGVMIHKAYIANSWHLPELVILHGPSKQCQQESDSCPSEQVMELM